MIADRAVASILNHRVPRGTKQVQLQREQTDAQDVRSISAKQRVFWQQHNSCFGNLPCCCVNLPARYMTLDCRASEGREGSAGLGMLPEAVGHTWTRTAQVIASSGKTVQRGRVST